MKTRNLQHYLQTRMHSSRMRTVRNRSRLLGGRCLLWGGSGPRGVPALGGSGPREVPAPWGSGPGGGIPACTEADPPGQTDRQV